MNKDSSTQRPLVSVILAVFNEARSIEECLNSLLKQETPDFDLEILAIDGRSNDGTKEILDGIAASDLEYTCWLTKREGRPTRST